MRFVTHFELHVCFIEKNSEIIAFQALVFLSFLINLIFVENIQIM